MNEWSNEAISLLVIILNDWFIDWNDRLNGLLKGLIVVFLPMMFMHKYTFIIEFHHSGIAVSCFLRGRK